MPDRLASHIVNAVVEALMEYHCLDSVYIGTINLNNATDAAIEEVEKLLRQD